MAVGTFLSDSGFLRCMAEPTPAVYGEVRLSVHGEVEGSDQSDPATAVITIVSD